jgi:hypothetical protein
MRKQNYRFFRMIYDPISEVRLVVENECDVVFAGEFATVVFSVLSLAVNVFRGNNRKLIPRNVAFERNTFYSSTGNVATYSCAVQHSGKAEVINVKCGPGNFLTAFFSRD